MSNVKLMQGDCLQLMKDIPDKSIDMILCDLPYGTTKNAWDKKLDLDRLFTEYNRISKSGGYRSYSLSCHLQRISLMQIGKDLDMSGSGRRIT